MNFKNPDFYRRSENFFPKKDNSVLFRRALSKKYKEDTNKYFITQDEINDEKEINEDEESMKNNDYRQKNIVYNKNTNSLNMKSKYNKNFYQTYTQKNNFNTRGTFYKRNNYENQPNNNDKLLERINKKNKYNINMNTNKYYTTNMNEDNVYQEFIINYNSGIYPDDNKYSNTLDRKKPNTIFNKNKIYNRVALNNGIYKIDKKSFNNNKNLFGKNEIEYFNSTTYQPYQRRKIVDFNEKDQIENGMPKRIKKELYFKNNQGNLTNYNFFEKKIRRNAYTNYNFNTYNQNENNYDINSNNNIYKNKYKFNISQKDFNNRNKNRYLIINNNKLIEQKINSFLEHFSEYCIQYYHRIIRQLFYNLKRTRKYKIITQKHIPKNSYNITVQNKKIEKTNYKSNYRNYITKVINTENKSENNYNRIPHHKSTDLIIDRIKYDNKSKSPDKDNNFEMFRNIKELSKKYEAINNRKNRQSLNGNLKIGNDLSFNSGSIEKNKEKEKWEKNLEKEREIKKILEKRKDINNNINSNKQKIKDKKNLIYIKDDDNINNKKDNEEKESIRKKYKKLNLNNKTNKNTNIKSQMKIVKKIQTRDKKIQINIKYLNYYKPNKIKEKNNNSESKYDSLKKSDNFEIALFAVKNRNKNNKKEKNNAKDKKNLASIKEEKENKIGGSSPASDGDSEHA